MKLRALMVVIALSGCYAPKLGSPSFYCHPNDNPACPDGQKCVDGRCISDSVLVPADFAAAIPDAGNRDDMDSNNSPPDFSSAPSMPDLSTPPDLAKPSCVATGGDCTYHNNAVCCSNYCIYSSNTCK